MASIELAVGAIDDLERLILTHSLPVDTRQRLFRSLAAIARFPRMGGELEAPLVGFRFVLGPWRWMIVLYVYDETEDAVVVTSIEDARASSAATASRAQNP